MSAQIEVQNDPSLQRFTAAGRPMRSSMDTNRSMVVVGMLAGDSFGAAGSRLLPVRFTDDSIITVPVLAPGASNVTESIIDDSSSTKSLPKENKHRKSSIFSVFKYDKKAKPEFVMKHMTRGEYLKRYAKDDDGKYIGTEDPAPDCILRNLEDQMRFRSPLRYSILISDAE